MAIHVHVTEALLEIQNGKKKEGLLCCERLIVRVHDEGGAQFLSIKTDNLEPDEEYDRHTVTIGEESDIDELCAALKSFLKQANA